MAVIPPGEILKAYLYPKMINSDGVDFSELVLLYKQW